MLRVSWREGALSNTKGELEGAPTVLRVSWREGAPGNVEGELEGGCTEQC